MFAALPLFPDQASTHAERVDALYFFLLAVAGFFTVLIATLIIVFSIKYRRRSENDRPPHIEGDLKLEIFWSAGPLLIAVVIFIWGARVFFSASRPPDNCMDIYVVGQQWMWKVQYLGGQEEINTLHVPVGQPVKLTFISQDVIHDFAVPAFRLKQDVIPGRYTTAWFQATQTGTYHLFCDQYCGTNHSAMVGEVIVMTQADFQEWLSKGPDGGLAAKGAKLFRKLQCITCHSGDAGAEGPVLQGLYGRQVALQDGRTVTANDDYLRDSILYPDKDIVLGYAPIMPNFRGQVTEEEIQQLIAYIRWGRIVPRTERAVPPAVNKPRKQEP